MEQEPSTEPKWATELREMIRQVVREEIALHMERVVRHRAWLPGSALPRLVTPSHTSRSASREETPQQ
ncbi:hypothetical protein KSF_095970 [Reticulibacter mediterranei]|uniref:Uncharacterized protein n=1 Tax=Reticulibacter mediterranei TaxID=2778369 RepID=A0A8J3N5X3_9CHLR|nr:hypothetical protein [Reticulibacter mediterranei]GHO99549.1 hypothetical protein KSF_095970 [Reticulibacter mediterranei]